MKFKKILLPLDGSPLAERALAPAMCMAAGMSAEIVLLHVVVPLDIDLVLPEASLPHAAEEAGRYLAAVCARFATDGVNMTSAVVVDFNTATAVINYAEENEVDLIVMSSHGRSELTRWRYGSASPGRPSGALAATSGGPPRSSHLGTIAGSSMPKLRVLR